MFASSIKPVMNGVQIQEVCFNLVWVGWKVCAGCEVGIRFNRCGLKRSIF
jgi:hypothetical protein